MVSIAVDAGGIAAAQPWVERAGATFPTVVDSQNELARAYDFKVVPNGIMLDANQVVTYRQIGGFSSERAEDREVAAQLLRGETIPDSALPASTPPDEATALRRELVEAYWRLGQQLRQQGARAEAAAAWRRALRHDPDSFVIRKQIWALEHPERFGERIDVAWQKGQLAQERAAEAAECGPDGCLLPSA